MTFASVIALSAPKSKETHSWPVTRRADVKKLHAQTQFAVDIFDRKQDRYRPLGDVSPVVRTLAERQFDDYVKRVRVFLHPDVMQRLQASSKTVDWSDLL